MAEEEKKDIEEEEESDEPVEESEEQSEEQEKPKKKKGGIDITKYVIILILIGVIIYIGIYYADQVKSNPKVSCTLGIGPLDDIKDLSDPTLCYAGHVGAGGTIEYDELESEFRKQV
ncbi:hypothetical protein ACFLRC_02910 [Candidatus Altiarchaeota archaeon]